MISSTFIEMLIEKVTSKHIKQTISSLVALFNEIFDLFVQNMKGLVPFLIFELNNIILMRNLLTEQLPGGTLIPKISKTHTYK